MWWSSKTKQNKTKSYLHGFGWFSNPAMQISSWAQIIIFFLSPHSRGKQELQFCCIFALAVTDIQRYSKKKKHARASLGIHHTHWNVWNSTGDPVPLLCKSEFLLRQLQKNTANRSDARDVQHIRPGSTLAHFIPQHCWIHDFWFGF